MESVNTMPSYFEESSDRLIDREAETETGGEKKPSLLGWYHILRAHYHWPLFQAIRYALWLTR